MSPLEYRSQSVRLRTQGGPIARLSLAGHPRRFPPLSVQPLRLHSSGLVSDRGDVRQPSDPNSCVEGCFLARRHCLRLRLVVCREPPLPEGKLAVVAVNLHSSALKKFEDWLCGRKTP
jgi:hypothetical protein